MCGPSIGAGSSGVCSRISREVARLFDRLEGAPGRSLKERPRGRRHPLRIEPLEARQLLDAAGLASSISPIWFEDVSSGEDVSHAGVADWTTESADLSAEDAVASDVGEENLYDWIIQFDTASVENITSVAEVTTFLVGGGIDFQAVCGLGLVGQALVRSSDASLADVESWLSGNIYVSSFERDAISQIDTTPSDPGFDQLWGMDSIDAENAWTISTGSSSVVAAVIDTGVDYNHSDLAANIWVNPGEIAGNGIDDDGNGFVDDVHGYDFVNNDGDPMDDNGHGTHVSGTIAAEANNGRGVTGVNWSSSIMALKFLGSNGSGYLSDAVQAINYATMMRTQYGVNVRVLNNSWGGGGYSSALASAIQASCNADILFVAAAGNSGSNNDAMAQYPANYTSANVISVAAVDGADRLASFSSYGATTVDIAAPGVTIYSTTPGNTYSYYSGTSMATPHVAGVAALAFAAAPNATMAEVRDAIFQGADPVAALSGKMVTGGTLNAYNTMQLLTAEATPGPTIGSLTVSPGIVTAGTEVTLSAQGITDADGTVVEVCFMFDSNFNGQYDVTDAFPGSVTSIINGEASITVETTGLAPGTYYYFASACDNDTQWSDFATATLTVVADDDHGDNAATATAVGAVSSTSSTIGLVGDVDWFSFQAIAGKSYIFNTELVTLRDSVLSLYDRDGTTRLAYNDDGGAGLASKITWTAQTSGTYYLAVSGYSSLYTGDYVLDVEAQNAAPVLSAIGDQSISHAQTTLSIDLDATDANGDALTYGVQLFSVDSLAQAAYDLDQELGLYQWEGSYWTNLRGAGEKYLASYTNGVESPCFILPNGELYRWGGSIASSTLVATLSSDYYNDPTLLHEAQSPALTSIDSNDVTAGFSGDVLTIVRAKDFVEDFHVQVTVSDGSLSDSEMFEVSVTNSAPVLSAIGNQTIASSQTTLAISLDAVDADGDALAYSAELLSVDPLAQSAYDLDQELGLYQWEGSYWTDLRGAGEKYLASYTNGVESPCFILPNGELYRWGGSIASSTLVATLSSDYYNDPTLLHEAQSPTPTTISAGSVSVSLAGNTLHITRSTGYTDDFFIQVSVSDGDDVSSEAFRVSVSSAMSLQYATSANTPFITAAMPDVSMETSSRLDDTTSAWLARTGGDYLGYRLNAAEAPFGTMPFGRLAAYDGVFSRLASPELSPAFVRESSAGLHSQTERMFAIATEAILEEGAAVSDFRSMGSTDYRMIDGVFDSLDEQLSLLTSELL